MINLIGLAAGLSCTLLIYLWVSDELSVDKFHSGIDRIRQVMVYEKKDGAIATGDATPGPLGDAIKQEISGVEAAVTSCNWLTGSRLFLDRQSALVKADGKYAGKEFFNVFSYKLISGNAQSALKGSRSILISESLAKKMYGTTSVLGKQINWNHSSVPGERHALITGVFRDVPANSSDHFDYVVPLELLMEFTPPAKAWDSYGQQTYVKLKPNTDAQLFNADIRDFLQKRGVENIQLTSRLFSDGYLYGRYENGKPVGGRIDYVNLFSLIAILILGIACINFMNLSTAKASKRLKEVGIKKVIGANRTMLVKQYLLESISITFLAFIFALLITELLIPQFNELTGKHLALQPDLQMVSVGIIIVMITGLIAGSYPALYISGLDPVASLKGQLKKSIVELWTRKGLVIFQFTLSVVLMVAVFVIYKQIDYIQHRNLGFTRDNVLYFRAEGKLQNNSNTFINEAKKIPGVVNAAGFRGSILSSGLTTGWQGHNPARTVAFRAGGMSVGLIETMDMKMSLGRSFSDKFGADSSKIILNEAGVKAMGLTNPLGKTFRIWEEDFEIIGVVKDFNFESMHTAVRPMFLMLEGTVNSQVLIRIKASMEKETIQELTSLYTKFNPGFEFDYHFLNQDFQTQYLAENRVATLSGYFACLAILISCLGLFGLAAFTAERRMKEIGIRKVLGASEASIVKFLSADFLSPVIIAVFIALPTSYLFAGNWLNSFAYRTDLKIWYFLVAGLLAVIISWLTVAVQAIRAATISPIKTLKSE